MLLTIKTKLYREDDSWTGEATINTDKGPLTLVARHPMAPERSRAADVVGKLYLTDSQSIPISDPDFAIVGAVGDLQDEGLIDDPEALAVVLGCIGSLRADEALNAAEEDDLHSELNYGFGGYEDNDFDDGNYSGRGLEIIGSEVGSFLSNLGKALISPVTAPVKAVVDIATGGNVVKAIGKLASAPLTSVVNTISPATAKLLDKEFGKAFAKVAEATTVLQGTLKVITNNPVWSIAATGISFIPGVGSAVSAGMSTAAAVGRGLSLKDAAILGAKSALPGGPLAAAALDVAIGVAQGDDLSNIALETVRNQLPGGALEKAVFDATTDVARGKPISAATAATLAKNLTPAQARKFADDLKKSKIMQSAEAKAVRDVVRKADEAKALKVAKTLGKELSKASSKWATVSKKSSVVLAPAKKPMTLKSKSDPKKAVLPTKGSITSTALANAKKDATTAKQASAAIAKSKETAAKAGKSLTPAAVVQEAKILDRAASQLTKSKVAKKLAAYVQEAVKQKTAEKIANSFASIPAAASYATALSTLEAAERGAKALNTAKADALKKQGKKSGEILKTVLGKTDGSASAAALATLVELAAQSKKGDRKAAMWLSLMARAKKDREKLRSTRTKLQTKLKALGSTAIVVMPDGRMLRGALSAIKGAKIVDPKKAKKNYPVAIDNGKIYQLPSATAPKGFKRV